jgi:hypothetical protein
MNLPEKSPEMESDLKKKNRNLSFRLTSFWGFWVLVGSNVLKL